MNRSVLIKLGIFGLLVVGVGWGVLKIPPTEVTPERVRAFVLSFGVWAPAMFLMIYGQPVIPLPASVMAATSGLAFGPLWGLLAAVCGATIRACGQFCIARLLGRDAVARLLKGRVAALDEKIGAHGFKAVLLIRLIPNFPFDVQNYALGFSRVRFPHVVLGTLLGAVPGHFAFVYFGYSLSDPQQLWKLAVAIVLLVGFIVWQRRSAKRQRVAP